MEEKVAKVPPGVDRGRCTFVVGDACDMPALKLGKFDAGTHGHSFPIPPPEFAALGGVLCLAALTPAWGALARERG